MNASLAFAGRCLGGALIAGVLVAVGAAALATAPAAAASATPLSTSNNTPFPTSTLITGATWTSARYFPPSNQFGDILSTSSSTGDSLYVLIDDGGTGTSGGALWRNSFAQVTGTPGDLTFTAVGNSGAAKTYAQVGGNEDRLTGPLGAYYSMGFTIVNGVFYATQANNWNWNANGPFNGLAGIAYSTDQGQHWQFPKESFPSPTGNLNFIQYGDDAAAPDGYVYAIATEREFNASTLILGRARADVADITNPARWQWAAGSTTSGEKQVPIWTNSIPRAKPVLTWNDHITYPRISYDPALHRYLLTFTYSYASAPPGIWKDGSELVILESPTPWGPFSFVARDADFGPSNGYDPAIPENWIAANGLHMWMIWAANFDGCAGGLDCSGAYGFNYRQLQLTLAPGATPTSGSASAPATPQHKLPGTPPRHRLPRVPAAITSGRSRWIPEPEPPVSD
ncbi:MAG: DUF4185 domain-containing protein [Solirubrobacterales bacterium]|nr:DUF4185 domain-containing protein [Solirubrobacterales bacterium]